jgi:hypothetical protein
VTICPHCIKELKFLLEIFSHEKRITEDIKKLINANLIKTKERKEKFRFFSSRIFWKYAAVATSILLIFLTVTVLDVFKKQKFRDDRTTQIRLIEPVNEHKKKSDILFKWEYKSDSEFFILEIFNESLIPFWESEKIRETCLKLPDKITLRLKKDEVYFWMITAYSPEGRKIESRLEKFIVEN